jgi:lipoprotein-anchoring transpeptidase ErfK/SrfK
MRTRAIVAAVLVSALPASAAHAQTQAPDPPPPTGPVVVAGVTVGKVDVSGQDRAGVIATLNDAIAKPLQQKIVVTIGSRHFVLYPRAAGVGVDTAALADRALSRRVAGDVPVNVAVTAGAAQAFVDSIASRVYRSPRNSYVIFAVQHLRAAGYRNGIRLATPAYLRDNVNATLRSWTRPRSLPTGLAKVKPYLTQKRLKAVTGAIVTVSRWERRARIFSHLRFVRSYRVAVGQPAYPTPTGLFHVQIKQVNPSWSVPSSGWAGALAGQTIPGGDPRNPIVSRWIGFAGSVGFHGTNDLGSLGASASHGCIRMAVDSVEDLFRRVSIGTPVYVR